MMDRRAFLAGAGAVLVAEPLAAEAQQAGKVYRVGVIASTSSVAELAQHASRVPVHESAASVWANCHE
jgi:hypothetical protein